MTRLHMFIIGIIKAEMEARGWTQRTLAPRVGYSEKHITEMMHGRSGSVFAYDCILQELGIDFNDLFVIERHTPGQPLDNA
jgi:transcriptional regulator with XRE-family HTH domain